MEGALIRVWKLCFCDNGYEGMSSVIQRNSMTRWATISCSGQTYDKIKYQLRTHWL